MKMKAWYLQKIYKIYKLYHVERVREHSFAIGYKVAMKEFKNLFVGANSFTSIAKFSSSWSEIAIEERVQ